MILNQEYLDHPGISQSKLKKILLHPSYFLNNLKTDLDEEKECIIIGNAVDLILTETKEQKDSFSDLFDFNKEVKLGPLDEHYYISSVETPAPQIEKFFKHLRKTTGFKNFNDIDETILQNVYNEIGVKTPLFNKFIEEKIKPNINYFENIVQNENKILISKEEYEAILGITNSLKTNNFTKHIFNSENIVYQIPLFFKIEDIECKGLLDFIEYNPKTNTLIPTDLKTTSNSLLTFLYTVMKHRYDFQAAFYIFGVKSNLDYISDIFKISNEKRKDLKLGSFRFIVEHQKFYGKPLIYNIGKLIDIGFYGGKIEGKDYEGILHAIDKYRWHTEHDLWDYTKEQYLNKGVVDLSNNINIIANNENFDE